MCDTPHVNPRGVPLLKIGRDVHGRFTRANPGGPGNPFARKVAALRKALLDCVSEQDVKDMAEALKRQAKQGDRAAIKLILQYCVGRPEPPKDPDRMDADEWGRLRQMRVSEREYHRTLEATPACVACHRAEFAWPCTAQDGHLAQTIHDIHKDLRVSASANPDAAPTRPGEGTADRTAGASAQVGPAQPPAERPSPEKGARKPSAGREPAVRPGGDRRSLTQPPSPNGANEEERRQPPKSRRHPIRPARPCGQAGREPPRG